jgi:hypothetical protein
MNVTGSSTLLFLGLAALACAGDSAAPTPRGITGTWVGEQTAAMGTSICPVTQSLTEGSGGTVTGTATLGAPCAVLSFTVTGTNNTGGVADSTELTWTVVGGNVQVSLSGRFDGADMMSGGWIGPDPDCSTAGRCTYSFTRTSSVP